MMLQFKGMWYLLFCNTHQVFLAYTGNSELEPNTHAGVIFSFFWAFFSLLMISISISTAKLFIDPVQMVTLVI